MKFNVINIKYLAFAKTVLKDALKMSSFLYFPKINGFTVI